MFVEILISVFLLIGAFFILLGSVGIIRFPDVYGRLHAATKSATLGVIAIMFGMFLYFLITAGEFSGKTLLSILFVFLTAPVAGHMISQSAYKSGVPLWSESKEDDLKIVLEFMEEERLKQEHEQTDNMDIQEKLEKALEEKLDGHDDPNPAPSQRKDTC